MNDEKLIEAMAAVMCNRLNMQEYRVLLPKEAIAAARAALAVVRREEGWQSMDSAPKDGSGFLAFYDADLGIYHVVWSDEHREFVSHDWEITNFMQRDFKGWRPLPSPPDATQGERDGE